MIKLFTKSAQKLELEEMFEFDFSNHRDFKLKRWSDQPSVLSGKIASSLGKTFVQDSPEFLVSAGKDSYFHQDYTSRSDDGRKSSKETSSEIGFRRRFRVVCTMKAHL